jgi:hypothetical protein
MGYEAKGDASTDVAYYLFDKHGKKLEECWFQVPFAGMMQYVMPRAPHCGIHGGILTTSK